MTPENTETQKEKMNSLSSVGICVHLWIIFRISRQAANKTPLRFASAFHLRAEFLELFQIALFDAGLHAGEGRVEICHRNGLRGIISAFL